jgi:predicted metal-binding membrane protein
VTAIALAPVRRKPWVVAALLGAAGLAWWSTAVRMEGMDAGPGTSLGSIGWFAGAWAAMMAAMMLPSLAPTVAAFATHVRGVGRWALFALGYLLTWTTAGLTAYGLFELGKHLLGGELAWHAGGRWAAVGVLFLSAAYQLTPVKAACLNRCRMPPTPTGRGAPGAVATGLRAGIWCIGCTWALMAALFALGVMSITWMVLIALLVALEKVGPWQHVGRMVTATILIALAVGIAAAPGQVPGLVVPDSSGAMHAMKVMGQR